jgi:glycosyltransferase involved in cell wall biosynthesis
MSNPELIQFNTVLPGKTMPKVSVILPTHNRRHVLQRAVQSVLDQTYKDYEIIVVNDGSTDDTANYLSTLDSKTVRSIHSDRNIGGSHARNQGIDHSNGDYIAFLDDDDAWEPNKLEEQVSLLSTSGAGLCRTGFNLFSRNGTFIKYVYKVPKSDDLYKSIIADNFLGGTSSVLVKRTLVKAINGFDPELPALQDWDFFIRLLKQDTTIAGIDKPLVRYYFMDDARNVSFNFKNHMAAVKHLKMKYQQEKEFRLLKTALLMTTIKKALKSRGFLREFIQGFVEEISVQK